MAGIGALDPGAPGSADNGTASVSLLPGNPNEVDPPLPFLAGVFTPNETSDELVAMGFGAGDTVRFSFPGGADIGAFTADVVLPDEIVVLTPDLNDTGYTLDTGSSLNLTWVPGDSSDTVAVTLTGSSFSLSGGSVGGQTVVITCEFPDTGSGTVPLEAVSRLPTDSTATTLSVGRKRTLQASVPLLRVAGEGVVDLVGGVSVTRTIIAIPGLPDLPDLPDFSDFDPCSLIPCPEGQVCDPETFMCVSP